MKTYRYTILTPNPLRKDDPYQTIGWCEAKHIEAAYNVANLEAIDRCGKVSEVRQVM